MICYERRSLTINFIKNYNNPHPHVFRPTIILIVYRAMRDHFVKYFFGLYSIAKKQIKKINKEENYFVKRKKKHNEDNIKRSKINTKMVVIVS
jgi:hypothetical protein